MSKWLEFRVTKSCEHESDLYDGCPLCRIEGLEAEVRELNSLVDALESRIAEEGLPQR